MKLMGLFIFGLWHTLLFSQQTVVSGRVSDKKGEPLSDVLIQYQNSKMSTKSDSLGNFILSTYYPTDTLIFRLIGYQTQRYKISADKVTQLNVKMPSQDKEIDEILLKAPTESKGAQLHRRMMTYKDVNNKEKLSAYAYHLYNKIELDACNLDTNLFSNQRLERLDLLNDYLQTDSNNKGFLPVILSETVSDYYFLKNPKLKKEVIEATHLTGVDNMQMTQFLGDMYLELNIYDNIYDLFNKSFISPVANFARSFYKFYLEDSTFIGNQWCYKLRFTPKRTGDMTFEGEMWIHDTTYAVKSFKANISPWTNINYVQDLLIHHEFEQVAPEVWMLTSEKMFADIKLLSILAVIMPILLVVEMPLFSLKISNEESISSRLNIFRMLLILSAVILFFVFQFAAIPFIVILYLILSLLNNIL